ncbi:hypothetical protein [Pelosinus baikalensis]|jgi:hypothetical protein|uniref:Uncharacterized protein n=1 Tax=Pelosinus baikalensis TaxID=2892015 RepID=A0ABS8HNN1_9FIRM|nr:hypothetical protein [Pelosinus baikalensis]MCC5464791.1 hypothetical protein [Pelosinus baikalensis]
MKYYTINILEAMYREKYPELAATIIHEKAKLLHSQLNTLDVRWKRSNRLFYSKIDLYGM